MVHADTKPYWIPTHLRACRAASDTILLDLKRNRYIAVGRREGHVLSTLAANWLGECSPPEEAMPPDQSGAIADALVRAGLLTVETPGETLATGTIDLAGRLSSAGHEIERVARPGVMHIGRFLTALAWARRAIRSRTLYEVAAEISARKRGAAAFDTDRAIELTCVFRSLRPYAFVARDRCLFHALALTNFLARFDIYAAWVIGVRTRPWAAHSWVQQGKLLLDANPEHVCEYTPILVV